MPIHAPQILVFGAKIGEGIFGFRPQPNQFFRFRPQRFLPNFVKIGSKCDRKRAHRDIHTYMHTYTETKKTDLIICPMLWYSNGTDKNHRKFKFGENVTRCACNWRIGSSSSAVHYRITSDKVELDFALKVKRRLSPKRRLSFNAKYDVMHCRRRRINPSIYSHDLNFRSRE